MTSSNKFIYNELPRCSDTQYYEWKKEAATFIEKTGFYSSIKYDAILAVTEYIAYKNGYTIRGDYSK